MLLAHVPGCTRECSTRPNVLSTLYDPEPDVVDAFLDGAIHWDDATWAKCTIDGRGDGNAMPPAASCGDVYPANVTTCTSTCDGIVTKEFLLGPFTSTGGYDWWKLKALPGNDPLPRELRVVGYSFTFHAGALPTTGDDLPGANLGLPPFHNHHSGINFENGIIFFNQGDNQCAGHVDEFECMSHDLGSLGYMEYALPGLNADLSVLSLTDPASIRGFGAPSLGAPFDSA